VRQLKLIWQSQKINVKKIISRKRRILFSSTLSSTVCLLHTLFEDLECAIELHEKIANEVTALHSLDPRNYLFNGQEEGDYLFGQGIMNEASSDDKEYLQLYESWCLFAYREFYKKSACNFGCSQFTYVWRKNQYSKQILQTL
jgi:hypothetical protein